MKISELLKPESVQIGLQSTGKENILLELSQLMAKAHPDIDQKDAFRSLLDREQKGSTGVNRGLAVPHGRSTSAKGMHLIVVYDPKGKDFDSGDQLPSHLFFTVIAADTYSPHEQLEILRIIATIYEETDLKTKLEGIQDSKALFELILEKEKEIA